MHQLHTATKQRVSELEHELTTLVSQLMPPTAGIRYAELDETFPIVLSYRTEIKKEMLEIAQALRQAFGPRSVVHGMMCKPGQPWDAGYFQWLSRATVILPLLSDGYFESNPCQLEFKEACNQVPDPCATQRTVIPVVVTRLSHRMPADNPSCPANLKAQLNQRNCFPSTGQPYDKEALMDDFQTRMAELIALVHPFICGRKAAGEEGADKLNSSFDSDDSLSTGRSATSDVLTSVDSRSSIDSDHRHRLSEETLAKIRLEQEV